MRRAPIFLSAILGIATALAATAVPAFPAESGSLVGTITAASAPAPCLTVGDSVLDFGVLPFSTPGATRQSQNRITSLTNCGEATQQVSASGTDASSAGGTWLLGNDLTACPLNGYSLVANAGVPVTLSYAPQLLRDTAAPAQWDGGQRHFIGLAIFMPCQGSNGAGEGKTFTVTFTATVV